MNPSSKHTARFLNPSMNHSERNRDLLKKVQQKAEALRETLDSNDQFETELEASNSVSN